MVKSPLRQHTFTVYGINTCPYCQGALREVQSMSNAIYHDITGIRQRVIGNMIERGLIPPHHRTVPVVFRYGEYIGGFTEMSHHTK